MFANVFIPVYSYGLADCIFTYFAEHFCSIVYILSLLTKSLIRVKEIKRKSIGVMNQNEGFSLFWVTKFVFVIMAIIYK